MRPLLDFEQLLVLENVLDERLEVERCTGLDTMSWSDYVSEQADLHRVCGYAWVDYERAIDARWSHLDALRLSPPPAMGLA